MKSMIKRIIVGVAIGLILASLNACTVKAATVISNLISQEYFYLGSNTRELTIPFGGMFTGTGNGYVYFNYLDSTSLNSAFASYDVQLIYTNNVQTPCEFGTVELPSNSSSEVYRSVKCKVNFTTGVGLSAIQFRYTSSTTYPTYVLLSKSITFFGNDSTDIINAINNINFNQILSSMQSIYNNQNNVAYAQHQDFLTLFDYFNSNSQLIQQQLQEQQETNTKIQETNDFLSDSSLPDNSSGDIGDLNNNIATNGTISSLVTMPITFLQKIINGLNGSCSPITIGELYEYNMTMPCINPQQYIGIIWNIIDVICAGFLSFHFGKKLVSIFHKITSMKDGGLEEAYD